MPDTWPAEDTDIPYEIRKASEDEIPVFIEFRERMFVEVGFEIPERFDRISEGYFAKAIPEGRFVALLAFAEGNVAVGSVGLSLYDMPPKPKQPEGSFGYVSSMYVANEHRGNGLARQLMAATISEASERGLTWLTLHASEAGRPIYEQIGFESWAEMALHVPTAVKNA